MSPTITTKRAYEKGRRSQSTQSDWDEALDRFSRKYCEPHPPLVLCDLERSWCNGWDDNGRGNRERDPRIVQFDIAS